jgi:hypothetical protein
VRLLAASGATGLRIEHPSLLAGLRIERQDAAGGGGQVEKTVDEHRPRLEGGDLTLRIGPFSTGELAGVKLPDALKLRHVGRCD